MLNHLRQFLECFLGTVQVLVIISCLFPQILLLFAPVMCLTLFFSYQFLHISREVKRIDSLKKTPIFVLFSETLHGLPIIRSFSHQSGRFFAKSTNLIDQSNACHLYLWICNRWLSFRMQLLGAIVSGSTAALIVHDVIQGKESGGTTLSATAAALAMIYSLEFYGQLNFLSRTHADVSLALSPLPYSLYQCMSSVKWT